MFRVLIKSVAPIAVRPAFAAPRMARCFSSAPAEVKKTKVIIPDLVDTLEWVLDSPPNVHQFEEPPIIVEIEHLKALKAEEPTM